jgi:hypothetical protein
VSNQFVKEFFKQLKEPKTDDRPIKEKLDLDSIKNDFKQDFDKW